MQFILQKLFNQLPTVLQMFFILMDQNKIVHIANVVFHPQLVFNKVVQLMQVNIGAELRSQVANGNAGIAWITVDDLR